MHWIKSLLGLTILVISLTACKDDPDIYDRPDWLAGKVFTIIKEQAELTEFARAIERIGYDTIINKSGNYTAFGPSDDAFAVYFANNPDYASIEEMPIPELTRLVKYHIILDPWSKIQLRTLDVQGWIDTLDESNNKPRGYKRETLLRDENVKYGIAVAGANLDQHLIIVDTMETNDYKVVTSDSRKYVPIFYQEYFDIYNLQPFDYEYYFDRPFDGAGAIYYANAKIISDEHLAENGFVYVVDQVVEPLNNARQILSRDNKSTYSDFLDLVNQFPSFSYNEKRTEEQPGFAEGAQVDSLFDLTYPELPVNINTEKTSPPAGTSGLPQEVTIRFHYGVCAPTNEVLAQFEHDYFKINNGWGSLNEAPRNIKRIVARSYLTNNPIYYTDIMNGFYNGELDMVQLDPSAIIQKEYASNSTFLGVNQAIVPRAFSSVTGPVYLRKGYSKVMYAIQESGLLNALKRPDEDYMLFIPSDVSTSIDSSFFYISYSRRFKTILRDGADFQEYNLSIDDLRTLLLNHTGTHRPRGIARKEFIENLAGNYIIVNNETGEIRGTAPTQDGYRGLEVDADVPSVISENADNGVTYDINHWFSFSSTGLGNYISFNYSRYFNLLKRAGLAGVVDLNADFILNSEVYTVFIPSDEALDNANIDALSNNELKKLLMLHFVEGDLIFTDGNKSAAYYTTTRLNEQSPGKTRMYIEPGIDIIRFHDKSNAIYAEIEESEKTNFVAARNAVGTQGAIIPQLRTYAVVHEIDKVLMLDSLDTN